MSNDRVRRAEILDTAATLFATSGVRATLKDIADACGILAGSLYHHFDSKEAIIVELVRRYRTELDDVAHAALEQAEAPNARFSLDMIVALGEAIAACAVKHRAALLLTYYEPPAGAGEELTLLAAETTTEIQRAMLALLRAGRKRGFIRRGVDLALLADRLCQSMLHVGIGVSHRMSGADRMPAIRCSILLEGVAAGRVRDGALDRSSAFRAADTLIAAWQVPDLVNGDRSALILAAARGEFGRRGYEATTMRDIAAAAGLSVASVYRVVESKEHLLVTIMQAYASRVTTGWDRVLSSPSSALERLDALLWFNINVMDKFSEEFRIQFAGLRQTPPDSPDLTWTFPAQLRQVKSLLAEGVRSDELRVNGDSADIRARCLFELLWMPEGIVRTATPRGALDLLRNTLLRGAAEPAPAGRTANN